MAATAAKETFYISHGSPALSIDESIPARNFLKSFTNTIYNHKPSSILIISAHWETTEPTVTIISGINNTIHDFNNFPKEMYQLKYPAPGAPNLGKRVKELLESSGLFHCVEEDNKRGLDHGAWVPLMLMYPAADIPVCQLSVQPEKDGSYHYNMGKILSFLKEEGVLIIGSGSATHNLRTINRLSKNADVVPWALEFDTWLKDALIHGRYEDVNKYEEKAPLARLAHPRPEHIFPLHVAMGAAGEVAKAEPIFQHISAGTLSYASYKFTN